MNNHLSEERLLERNLRDAGCTDADIRRFSALTPADRRLFLARKRSALLEELHEQQARIDCLDYLVYSMNKK